MSSENPKYWGLRGDERLACETIEDRLDELHEDGDGCMPESIEMVGYDPHEFSDADRERLCEWVINILLESIDEDPEFGGEDYTSPTPAMIEAAKEFVAKVTAEYKVWSCTEVCRKTVRVADYIKPEGGNP